MQADPKQGEPLGGRSFRNSISYWGAEFCQRFNVRYPCLVASSRHYGRDLTARALAQMNLLGSHAVYANSQSAMESQFNEINDQFSDLEYSVELKGAGYSLASFASLLKHKINVIQVRGSCEPSLGVIYFRVKNLRMRYKDELTPAQSIIVHADHAHLVEPYLLPPSPGSLRILYERGYISAEEAKLAQELPIADAIVLPIGDSDVKLSPYGRDVWTRYPGHIRPLIGVRSPLITPTGIAQNLTQGADFVYIEGLTDLFPESGASLYLREQLASAQEGDLSWSWDWSSESKPERVRVITNNLSYHKNMSDLMNLFDLGLDVSALTPNELDLLESYLGCDWKKALSYAKHFFEKHHVSNEDHTLSERQSFQLLLEWYSAQAAHWAYIGRMDKQNHHLIRAHKGLTSFNNWAGSRLLNSLDQCSIGSAIEELMMGALALLRRSP